MTIRQGASKRVPRDQAVAMTSLPELHLAQEIKWLKLPTPDREYRFHTERRWRFDFAWPLVLLAVEVEGGSWVNGAHTRGKHFEADCEKYNEALCLGWRVLRVTPAQITSGEAIRWIEQCLLPG